MQSRRYGQKAQIFCKACNAFVEVCTGRRLDDDAVDAVDAVDASASEPASVSQPAAGASRHRSVKWEVQPRAQRKYHAFLTHDWGTDGEGRDNHERVIRVCHALRARAGLSIWLDEDEMRGDVNQQMTDGIEDSACVIAFVTRRYIEKAGGKGANGADDNCKFEARSAPAPSPCLKGADRSRVHVPLSPAHAPRSHAPHSPRSAV